MSDDPIYVDANRNKVPVVVLQVMLLDERNMMFELVRKHDFNE